MWTRKAETAESKKTDQDCAYSSDCDLIKAKFEALFPQHNQLLINGENHSINLPRVNRFHK